MRVIEKMRCMRRNFGHSYLVDLVDLVDLHKWLR